MKKYKYSGITKDGLFVQTDNIEDIKVEDFESLLFTETMTKEKVEEYFGRNYDIPKDLKAVRTIKIK